MKKIFIGLLLCGFSACAPPRLPLPPAELGAYYWKTRFIWSEADTKIAKDLGLSRMYVRYLDVALSSEGKPMPIAVNEAGTEGLPLEFEAIPVVFLVNSVFETIKSDAKLTELSRLLSEKIRQIHGNRPLSELQLDCDWSKGTAAAYFSFLTKMKTEMRCNISTTLRLWQFKNRALAGIPPADRAHLMAYNLQNPKDWAVENSILDVEQAKPYLTKQAPYPIPMDVALPAFAWAVHFRNGKSIGLIKEVTEEMLQNAAFLSKDSPHRYRCVEDAFFQKTPLIKGDMLRFEGSNTKTNSEAMELLRPYLPENQPFRLVFYDFHHLSSHGTLLLDPALLGGK